MCSRKSWTCGRCMSVTNKFPYTDTWMSIPLYQICLKLRIVCSTPVLPRTPTNILILMSVRMTWYTGENMTGFHDSSMTGLVADMDIVCKNFCRQQLCNFVIQCWNLHASPVLSILPPPVAWYEKQTKPTYIIEQQYIALYHIYMHF
jgi:hypothetical protein